MKKNNQDIAIPSVSSYGASELKLYISTATYKAFATALGLSFLLLITIYGIMHFHNEVQLINEHPHSFITISTIPIKAPPIIEIRVPAEFGSSKIPSEATGTKEIAGKYVPVEASKVDINQILASNNNIANSSSKIGTANTINEIKFVGNNSSTLTTIDTRNDTPSPDDITTVEKEPEVNMTDLQKSVVYPDLARRAGVSGLVIIRALISEDGNVIDSRIEFSESILLEEAAMNAVKILKAVKPAIQNGRNVKCWVNIPIKFQLR